MKKICFVAEYMYCGGTEKSLLSLLNYLDREKYDITILLMKKKGDLLPQLPNDVKVDEIPVPEDEVEDLLQGRSAALICAIKSGQFFKAVKKAYRGIKMSIQTHSGAEKRLWYYQSIEKKLKEYPGEFDAVIDYMGYGLFNTFYAARKIHGKVKISWVHFEPDQAMPDFYAFGELLNEYDHIMCVSQNSMKQVQNMIPELEGKCRVFYNIVNKENLQKKAKEEKIKKLTERFYVLSVGRLDPPKGFDMGIKVISRLYGEGYPVKWQIIGEGWQRKELEDRISSDKNAINCVELLGQKLNPYPYFAACDIYFMPSRHEGYGLVLAEAKAFNKPIVVTDFAGAREQLINGETGIIAECTEESLYQALKQMLDDESLREKFENNLAKIQDDYPSQIAILENIIEENV